MSRNGTNHVLPVCVCDAAEDAHPSVQRYAAAEAQNAVNKTHTTAGIMRHGIPNNAARERSRMFAGSRQKMLAEEARGSVKRSCRRA